MGILFGLLLVLVLLPVVLVVVAKLVSYAATSVIAVLPCLLVLWIVVMGFKLILRALFK